MIKTEDVNLAMVKQVAMPVISEYGFTRHQYHLIIITVPRPVSNTIRYLYASIIRSSLVVIKSATTIRKIIPSLENLT